VFAARCVRDMQCAIVVWPQGFISHQEDTHPMLAAVAAVDDRKLLESRSMPSLEA